MFRLVVIFVKIVEMPTSNAAFSFPIYESATVFELFFKALFASFDGLAAVGMKLVWKRETAKFS